ncbi:hypothetical protein [Streptomyces griseochromogenes]|uniref:hypothetical protein n=1 Tax=Streptomyces griseochromogenes TaxID=68214 RepID=UPI00378C7F4A
MRFDQYGGRDELYIADVDVPVPAPGQGRDFAGVVVGTGAELLGWTWERAGHAE